MGGNNSALNQQNAITQEQIGIANQQNALQQQNYDRMVQLQQPEVTRQTNLASGDPTSILTAAQPTISQVSGGYNAAKSNIFNNIAPGAARDKALADLEASKATAIGNTEANLVNEAPAKLANIGAGYGSFSLQELGAAINSLGGASNSNQSVLSAQENAKSSTMSFLGSLAGAGGSIFQGKSDRRLKENISNLADSLEKILKLEIVNFDYIGGDKNQAGVIAQQIQDIVPEAVSNERGLFLVDYSRIAMMAIKALQELTARVSQLEMVLAEQVAEAPYVEGDRA